MKVRDLKIKTGKFKNTQLLTSKKNIFIIADSFENISGKIQALQDMKFNIKGTFINSGK